MARACTANACHFHPKRPAGLCLECVLHNSGLTRDPAIERKLRYTRKQFFQRTRKPK